MASILANSLSVSVSYDCSSFITRLHIPVFNFNVAIFTMFFSLCVCVFPSFSLPSCSSLSYDGYSNLFTVSSEIIWLPLTSFFIFCYQSRTPNQNFNVLHNFIYKSYWLVVAQVLIRLLHTQNVQSTFFFSTISRSSHERMNHKNDDSHFQGKPNLSKGKVVQESEPGRVITGDHSSA